MGKSQARRFREATKCFGRENRNRWANARQSLLYLVHARKVEAGLISPAVAVTHPANTGLALVKRYSTSLTHQENEDKFGRSR